ncbi:hypothetical protein GTZ99_09660 [Novosphingobium sp. FSY-8]|uniref:Uncharacterized protein n=1 Tax=Novosphingobium ovatum TaxID=1908523 RepID=A0ABW9XE63_9SPHN|nr:hypothetical protein [Novosphingobium ovatum]NBC36822.1 hypothetical protein [Novosphingobium ovatum]
MPREPRPFPRFIRSPWIGCFILAFALVLVQAIPLLGWLLTILGLSLLIALLINMGFAAMALEAALRPQSRLLFVWPLLWFGGYGFVALISHMQADQMRAAAAAQNAAAHVRWDPATTALRFDHMDDSGTFWGLDLEPGFAVQAYPIDRAFRRAPAGGTRWGASGASWLEYRDCPGPMGIGSTDDERQWSMVWRGGYGTTQPFHKITGVCAWSGPAEPTGPVVDVVAAPVQRIGGLVEGITQDMTINAPDQRPVTVRALQVGALPWTPWLLINLWPDRGGAKLGFYRGNWRVFKDGTNATPLPVVAAALGLKPTTIEAKVAAAHRQ